MVLPTHALINWLGSTQVSWICIHTHTHTHTRIYGIHKSAVLAESWCFLCWRQEIVHRICSFGYTCTVYSTDPIQAVTSLAKFWPDLNCTARLPGTSRLINTVPGIGLKWHHQYLYDGHLLLNASFWAYNLCCMPCMRRRMDEPICFSQPASCKRWTESETIVDLWANLCCQSDNPTLLQPRCRRIPN